MTDRASIIIPAWNHAQYLADAMGSALAQSTDVQVIVVDDGSTDATQAIVARFRSRIVDIRQPHAGVAAARNRGIEAATGEFVCFLDADDVLYPGKIAAQLAAFAQWPTCDWVVCDTRIVDESSRITQLASERYDYAAMGLPGRSDFAALLKDRNFIPMHAPLIRRSALGGIEFAPGALEDWAFWRLLAARAPARYIPDVLCEYRRRRGGRNQGK